MCLAIPARIIAVGDGQVARADMGGISKEISLALLDDCAAGDWVIVHVGYALHKLDPAEAERTLQLFASAAAERP